MLLLIPCLCLISFHENFLLADFDFEITLLIYSSVKVVCQYAAPGLHAKIFFHPLFSISEVLKGSDGAIMSKIAKNHTHQQQSDNKHPIDLVITCNQISVSTCCILPD